ncbi:MAG TPA: MFS transporter [Gemmatimonadaceae bacterium]|nr:MFS transporter [Gemmatimonadaceae bacterium]
MEASARITLLRLGAAYALAWVTTSMVAGPGSAALVSLTGTLTFSGLFVALFYVGAAIGAGLGGRAMDRFGRRSPLIAAYLVAALGFTAAGVAVDRGSAALFVPGVLLLAAAFGVVNLTRLAAAEMFPPAERGSGVAWVQIAAIFGAVAGPLLLILSEPLGRLLGRAPLGLVWYFAPPLLVAAALLVRSGGEPRRYVEPPGSPAGLTTGAAGAGVPDAARLVLAGSVSLAASQAAMASVMGVAGAAVSHAGHGVSVLGSLMLMHFLGMFALSRLIGRIADVVGRRLTILSGLGLLATGGLVVAVVPGSTGFGIGLLLVGLGWSFGFIGSTVLITDVAAPERRARTLGRADLAAQLSAALIATGGGWWFASRGLAGLGITAAAVAAAPVLLVAFVRERKPGHYMLSGPAGVEGR